MLNYNEAKSLAKMNKPEWNEREYIEKANVSYFDEEFIYEYEILNEDMLDDKAFQNYVQKVAVEFSKSDADEKGIKFAGLEAIKYIYGTIDDDELFDREYEEACEHEFDLLNDR
jgi:hypothetical protein